MNTEEEKHWNAFKTEPMNEKGVLLKRYNGEIPEESII